MTRQGSNFVIPVRWIKIGAALVAIAGVLGPALGAGVAYIVRDVSQQKDIDQLKEDTKQDKENAKRDKYEIIARLERIEGLLMERAK